MAKRPRNLWRRPNGSFRLGQGKPGRRQPRRAAAHALPARLRARLGRGAGGTAGVATVQQYCAGLLRDAIEEAERREQVAEAEARRGALEGFHAITEDPEYLAEWSASAAPATAAEIQSSTGRRPAPARRTPCPTDPAPPPRSSSATPPSGPTTRPASWPPSAGARRSPRPALGRAAPGAQRPGGRVPRRPCDRPPARLRPAPAGLRVAGPPHRRLARGLRRLDRRRSSAPSRRPSSASSRARTSAIIPPGPTRRAPVELARPARRRPPRRRPIRLGHRPARRRSTTSARPSPRRVAEGLAIYPQGGADRARLRRHPRAGPAWRSTSTGLDRVIDYPAADMTITVEAGITLADAPAVLADRGPAARRSTPPSPTGPRSAAIYATNTSGPRRFGLGPAARPDHRRRLRHGRRRAGQGGRAGRQERRRLRLPQAPDRLDGDARRHRPADAEGPAQARGHGARLGPVPQAGRRVAAASTG